MATVTEMEARARVRADQDESTFPTSAQYLQLIADSGEELWSRMVAAGLKPAQTLVTVNANGAANYTIGTNVMVVLSVERQDSSEKIPLARAQEEDLPYLRSMGTNQAGWYDLIGGATSALTIELFPVPASGTYFVRYIPRFTRFTSGADVWYGPPRSDEYIVVSTAARALGKEGDKAGAAALDKELDKIWEDVVRMASWQDAQNPGVVRDARQWDWNGRRRWPFDDYGVRNGDGRGW
jgi:hypothetical protein